METFNIKTFSSVGWSPNSKLLGKWCGVKTDETIESSGSNMFLRVVTDDENFAKGFKLYVSTTSQSDSGKHNSFRVAINDMYNVSNSHHFKCQSVQKLSEGKHQISHLRCLSLPPGQTAFTSFISVFPTGFICKFCIKI